MDKDPLIQSISLSILLCRINTLFVIDNNTATPPPYYAPTNPPPPAQAYGSTYTYAQQPQHIVVWDNVFNVVLFLNHVCVCV